MLSWVGYDQNRAESTQIEGQAKLTWVESRIELVRDEGRAESISVEDLAKSTWAEG